MIINYIDKRGKNHTFEFNIKPIENKPIENKPLDYETTDTENIILGDEIIMAEITNDNKKVVKKHSPRKNKKTE